MYIHIDVFDYLSLDVPTICSRFCSLLQCKMALGEFCMASPAVISIHYNNFVGIPWEFAAVGRHTVWHFRYGQLFDHNVIEACH